MSQFHKKSNIWRKITCCGQIESHIITTLFYITLFEYEPFLHDNFVTHFASILKRFATGETSHLNVLASIEPLAQTCLTGH